MLNISNLKDLQEGVHEVDLIHQEETDIEVDLAVILIVIEENTALHTVVLDPIQMVEKRAKERIPCFQSLEMSRPK